MFFIAPAIFCTPADHVTFSKIFFFKKNIYTKTAIISHVLNQNY